MSIKFKKGVKYHIPNHKEVKLTMYKNFKKVTYVTHKSSNLKNFKKRKGNKFVNLHTGEIRQYAKPNKFKSNEALKRTLNNRARLLLENNFSGGHSEKFLTLTFDNICIDFNDLTRIFNNFWNRLTRYLKKQDLALICLYVKEVHQNGNWHIHALLKETHNKTLFIDIEKLRKIWGLGGVHINSVSSEQDNSDEEINIEKEMLENFAPKVHGLNKLIDYMCKLKSKENVIPSRARAYGIKGNLQMPTSIYKTYKSIYNNELKNSKLKGEGTILLEDDETGKIVNTICTEIWVDDKSNTFKKNK